MGMYTEIFVNVNLREGVPSDVLAVLRAMCDGEFGSPILDGRPARWGRLFKNNSYYTPSTQAGELSWDEIAGQWSLIGKGDIKNYESEIEQFFEWLMPWIDAEEGDFIGYMRYEESQTPTLVLKR